MISIIVPVYNVEKYLPRCIESIKNQTYKDYEVIFVNDGTTDASLQIIEEYAKRDSRVRILTQSNQGLSMARNNGLLIAKGEYIFFLDSDDAIHPQCLEILHYFAREYDAYLVCYQYKKCKLNKKIDDNFNINKISIKDIKFNITKEPIYSIIHVGELKINIEAWSKLYKKELIKNIKFIKGIYFEDIPYLFEVVKNISGNKTVIIDEKLYLYTYNEKSISNKYYTTKQIKDYFIGLQKVYKLYSNTKKELECIKKELIPSILKNQLKNIKNSKNNKMLYVYFAEELKYLFDKNMISIKYHRLWRYICYKYIVQRYFERGYIK